MQTDDTKSSDARLQRVLRAWEVKETLPPRFRERVWQRLARAEAPAPDGLWTQLLQRIAQAMMRPTLAVSYLTVLLAAGLLGGYWHARLDNQRIVDELGARYVQMLAPYESR